MGHWYTCFRILVISVLMVNMTARSLTRLLFKVVMGLADRSSNRLSYWNSQTIFIPCMVISWLCSKVCGVHCSERETSVDGYQDNGVFPKWVRNSVNSTNPENLIITEAWIRLRFKILSCYLCLAVTVVASWSLTQEVAGSNTLFKMIILLSLNSLNLAKTFRENSHTP